MDRYIGKKLDGRYQLLKLIGTGGMAYVYKATDLKDGSTVAVKILKDELLENEELVRRFKNESRAIGLLNHENIVKVLDVNFSDSVQYIVMEYLAGITLKEYIQAHGTLSWKETVYFAEQLLRALQHAHDRGIIHRDIKPQNVMLLENGRIKMMDFGIARFSRSGMHTITDKAIGTVHYISPEQARGEETDAQGDIYSVGVMMYEMCTGRLPFDADSAVSIALMQISDTPTKPRELNPAVPEGLQDIILKAMEKEPGMRYPSAGSMMQDIEQFKKNPGISFEYKYLSGNSPTIYLDRINPEEHSAPRSNTQDDSIGKDEMDKLEKKDKKEKKAGIGAAASKKQKGTRADGRPKTVDFPIALLMGITAACLIGSLILAVMTLNMSGSQLFTDHIDVELPDFVGQELRAVQANGEYSLFRFEVVEDYNNEYPAGTIFDQSPNPPKMVKDNADITLYVSKGTRLVTIPDDIVGSSYGDAVRALQALGLVVTRETDNSSEFDGNVITKVEPMSGSEVESGSNVTIYVNSPNTILFTRVPSVVGLDFTTAKATLMVNGLRVGTMVQADDPAPAGTVLGQSIVEGTSVSNGTAVDLVISSGVYEQEQTFTFAMPYADPNGNTTYNVEFYIGAELIGSVNGASMSAGAKLVRKGLYDENITIRISGIDYANAVLNYQQGTCEITESYAAQNGFTTSAPLTVSVFVAAGSGTATVNGAGSATVTAGGSATVTITPAEGYTIGTVTDNGSDVTAAASGGSYTISNIQASHSVQVTFVAVASDPATP
ncbi:MAG: Stk1 family PASTA domain-containing Ser/Thr kinase [Oscillospiraceae bacterium]|nr:Stk1 family PASTA domain-containing Ser/Thr kinase [Oscillospiraceae bacterium]